MACDVWVVEGFAEWYAGLSDGEAEAVGVIVQLLEEHGVRLGFPHSSLVHGTRRHAIRELRKQYQGRPLRILYAFDPSRSAILLLGGDKTGNDRWYEVHVPIAEARMDQYLAEIGGGT